MRSTPETLRLPIDSGDEPPLRLEELDRGTSVGRYLVLDRLGEGGMGVVYRAYDPDLDRSIALKLVRADQRNAERRQRLRARLMREAQTLARLSHPNVVAVHDVGLYKDDVFAAMQLVEGKTLRQVLVEDKPSPERIVAIFGAAARGLAAAHAVSIVHRDFKPDNVLVGRDGHVSVSDFGLAVALHEDDDLGGPGAVMGTPAYMAPEQVAGGDVDHRADQYSFCVSLYEACYGALPARPPELPARTSGCAWIAARVRAVLARGLATDPAQRFPSMTALIRKLESRPVVRALPYLGVVGAVAAIAGIVIATRPAAGAKCEPPDDQLAGVWDPAREAALGEALAKHGVDPGPVGAALDRYTAAWADMHVTSCRATHVTGEQSAELLDLRTECLQRRLFEVKHLTDALIAADAKASVRALEVVHGLTPVEDCANTTALRDPIPPRDKAVSRVLRDRHAAARVAFVFGNYDEALAAAKTLETESEAAGDPWLQATAIYLAGRAHHATGKPQEAIDQLYRAVELAEASRASDVAADAWMTIAWIVGQDLGKSAEAIRIVGVARGVIERLGGSPRHEATLEDYLGVLHTDRGELVIARHHLERALDLRARLHGKSDSEYASVLQHLAMLEQRLGHTEKALAIHHEARVIYEQSLGPAHPETLAVLGGEGATLYELGRYREAADLLTKGLATIEAGVGMDSDLAASFLTNLGLAQWKLKRIEEARTTLERALAIATKRGPESPRVATLHFNLALVLYDLDQPAAARAHAVQAAAVYEALEDADSVKASLEIVSIIDEG